MPSHRRARVILPAPCRKAWKIHKENGMPPIRFREGLTFPRDVLNAKARPSFKRMGGILQSRSRSRYWDKETASFEPEIHLNIQSTFSFLSINCRFYTFCVYTL